MIAHPRRLSVDFALTAAAQVAVAGSRTILFVVLARAGGPKPLADSSAVIALGTLLGLVSAAGTGPAATRTLAKLRASTASGSRKVLHGGLRDSIVGLGVVSAIAGAVEFAIGARWQAWNLVVFAFLYGLYQYFRSVDYGLGSVPAYLRTELLANGTIALLTPIIFLSPRLALVPFFVGYSLFSVVAGSRAYGATVRRSDGQSPSEAKDADFRAYALISGLGTAASMAGLQLSIVVADRALSSEAAGAFAAAFALLVPVLYLPRALATALLPAAAAEAESGERDGIRRTLGMLTSWSLVAALPLALIGEIFPRSILVMTSGARYASGANSLRLLLLASFFLIVSVPAVNVLSAGAVRSLWVPFSSAVVGLVVGIATWGFALSAGAGPEGVALGVLTGSATKSLIPVAFCLRRYGIAMWPVGLATAVVFAAAVLPHSGWIPFLVVGTGLLAELIFVRERRRHQSLRGLA